MLIRIIESDIEYVWQRSHFSRKGVDRILRYAFQIAQTRSRKKLTSATKSNGISHTMPYWDERVKEMAGSYPDVRWDQYHIDILAARFVLSPDLFDVVVASNLFGDILSDLGPACTGTIGIAPAGNINPERDFPSLFEPVHGSAPDIAGQGVANPVGQIWTAAMMLEHLGHKEAADGIVAAIETELPARKGPAHAGGDGGGHTELPGREFPGTVEEEWMKRSRRPGRRAAINVIPKNSQKKIRRLIQSSADSMHL